MKAYNKKTLSVDFDLQTLDKNIHIEVSDELIDELLIRQQSGESLVSDSNDNLIFVQWTTDKYKTWSAKDNDFVYVENYRELAQADAEIQKQALMSEASDAIAPLQDAVDLDMATPEEESALKEWKKYRVLLNRVDTSPGVGVVWPTRPASSAR
ncbi:tail fiber assembly protein [Morganella morganii]|uniref:tail fiber assembly protein n=1 Tax=Morganella morganii TaxID=582 RepID=UPI0016513F12|nr:tail fiber assembly protein [Morganella morganii]MBC6659640.1 tail fiber assembly protein [Morganella morganii]